MEKPIVLILMCILMLVTCANAEEIVYRQDVHRAASTNKEPVITGSMNPMVGGTYAYKVLNAEKVQQVTLFEAYPIDSEPGAYSLRNGKNITLNADSSFQYTFTSVKSYLICASYVKDKQSDNVFFFIDVTGQSDDIGKKVKEIAQLCRQSGASADYEIALWLHDWLTHHAYYDMTYSEHGPEGVLIKGYGVCESYSQAYQMLLNEFGIPNYCQTGITKGGNHEWNVVKLGREWCHVDVTYDDPTGGNVAVTGQEKYTYFGLPDSLIGIDHTYSVTYPCTTWDNIYYVRKGFPPIYSKIIDEGFLQEVTGLNEQAAKGLKTISVDVSEGYCIEYEASAYRFRVRRSTSGANIIFPVMAYLKSRTPMKGPGGRDVYYHFTYADHTLTGTLQTDPTVSKLSSAFVVPEGVKTVSEEAFAGIAAETVRVPACVTGIGSRAFADCKKLKHICIEGNNTVIARDAFAGTAGLVIHGAAGSTASRFAAAYGFEFAEE